MIPYNNGGPQYWRNEQSGQLESAVLAYFEPYSARTIDLTSHLLSESNISLLRMYLTHWADAPCYKANPHATEEDLRALHELITNAQSIQSRQDIDKWIEQALQLGIDPF